MRYRITVTELLPVAGAAALGEQAEGQSIFQTVVDFKPNLAKLVAALTPPRIRKARSAKA